MLPPAQRRSLSLGSWWIHQDSDPWSCQSWSCPGTTICSLNTPCQWSKWVRHHFLHVHLSMLCYDDHTILANKPRSALTTAAVTVGLIVLDVAIFPNGCKLDFGNGANKSISFHFSLFSAKQTKAALPLFSAVCKSSLMLSVLSLMMQC